MFGWNFDRLLWWKYIMLFIFLVTIIPLWIIDWITLCKIKHLDMVLQRYSGWAADRILG